MEFMKYAAEIAPCGMIITPGSMKIDAWVQKFGGCIVGVTDV
jgi:hypothetical protein